MPDVVKTIEAEITANAKPAELTYEAFVKKTLNPIELKLDADIKEAIKLFNILKDIIDKITTLGSKEAKFVNIAGMTKLNSTMSSIKETIDRVDISLGRLSEHFTSMTRSIDIKGQIDKNKEAVDEYSRSLENLLNTASKDKKNIGESFDNFLNRRGVKKQITEIMDDSNFKFVYDENEKNITRLLDGMVAASKEADGLSKIIQLTDERAVSLGEVFDKIVDSISSINKLKLIDKKTAEILEGSKLEKEGKDGKKEIYYGLKRETALELAKSYYGDIFHVLEDSATSMGLDNTSKSILTVLGNVRRLENELPNLQDKYQLALELEKSSAVNVTIDKDSIKGLSDAISELKTVTAENATFNIGEQDVERITTAFNTLKDTLQLIHDLLSSFDIPKIEVPKLETGEEKPRQETRLTVTRSTTMPNINGGSTTVTHTNDSSVTTGGTSGVDAAVDGLNRLQQELRETRQEVEETGRAIVNLENETKSNTVKEELPFKQQVSKNLTDISDWILTNTNMLMIPPVAYADGVEEIENVITKVTEFRDRLVEISQNDAFSTLSLNMLSDVLRSIGWLNTLIETELHTLEILRLFDSLKLDVPANKFAELAKKEIDETEQYLKRLVSGVSEMDPDGIISKYLFGENGIKSSEQLINEIQNEVKTIGDALHKEYLNGRKDIDYEKEFSEPFEKLRVSLSFGLIGYRDKVLSDTDLVIYDRYFKNTTGVTNELNDEQMSFWGQMIDALERLNILQKNGGLDYIEYLTKARSLSEEVLAARERNATFLKTDFETTKLTLEEADLRADNLLAEKDALDQLIASVEEFKKANKDMDDASSYFGNYLPDTAGLKTMSKMLEDEADDLKVLTIIRNKAQNKIFDNVFGKRFESKSNAPKELEEYYEELDDSFYPRQGTAPFTGEEAIEKLNAKAKELGVTFDETSKKWVQLSSSISSDNPITSVSGNTYSKELKTFGYANSSTLLSEPDELIFNRLMEKGLLLEQILNNIFNENPGATLLTVIDTVLQELNDTTTRAEDFNKILTEIRSGSKKWSFNDLLNNPDDFANDLNLLSDQLITIREAGNVDSKEALNLETRIQHMLAALSKVLDLPNRNAFMPYYNKVQSLLTENALAIQDEMWEAMANGGNLTSRNDFPGLILDRLGMSFDFSPSSTSFDIENLKRVLDILLNIDTIRSKISKDGQVNFYDDQAKRSLGIAKDLENRLIKTPEDEKEDDPEWVENQYKYIAEYLQKAEEYKKKVADIKGEVYEMQQFTADSVKSQILSGESPISSGSTPTTVLNVDALKEKIQDLNTQFLQSLDAMMKSSQGLRFNFYDEQLNILMKLLPLVEEYNSLVGAGASKNFGLDVKDILKNIDTLSGSKNASGVATSELGKFIRNAKAMYPDFDYSANIDLLELLHSKTISASDAFKELVNRQKELRQPNETPVLTGETESTEATADAHRDAAVAAEEHAEAAQKANEAESQTPESTTAPSEAQAEANEHEAETARQAAQAEEERANAAREANSEASSLTGNVPDTSSETESLNNLKSVIENDIPAAIEKKNQAFNDEEAVVSLVVQNEINKFDTLKGKISDIGTTINNELKNIDTFLESLSGVGDSVAALDDFFKTLGENSAFSQMFDSIKENQDAIKSFSDILKTTKELQEEAIANANIASDKVEEEKIIDPSQWREYLEGYDDLIEKLGTVVDIRRQIRVSEKDDKKYISYSIKGQNGSAIIGLNGRLLRSSVDYNMGLKEQQEETKMKYQSIVSAFKEFGEASSAVNNLLTDFLSGKVVTDELMTEALDRETEAAKKAADALRELSELSNTGTITPKLIMDADKIADEAMKRIADSENKLNNKRISIQLEDDVKQREDVLNKELLYLDEQEEVYLRERELAIEKGKRDEEVAKQSRQGYEQFWTDSLTQQDQQNLAALEKELLHLDQLEELYQRERELAIERGKRDAEYQRNQASQESQQRLDYEHFWSDALDQQDLDALEAELLRLDLREELYLRERELELERGRQQAEVVTRLNEEALQRELSYLDEQEDIYQRERLLALERGKRDAEYNNNLTAMANQNRLEYENFWANALNQQDLDALDEQLLYLDLLEEIYQKERLLALERGKRDAEYNNNQNVNYNNSRKDYQKWWANALDLQDVNNSKSIEDFYNQLIAKINELYEAKNKMNELNAQKASNPEITLTVAWANAVERLKQAYIDATVARRELDIIKEDITDEQYNDAINKWKQAQLGSKESLEKVANARNKSALNVISKEYEDQVAIINQATEAMNKYNEMRKNELVGKSFIDDEERSSIIANMEETSRAADEAIAKLKEMQEQGKISMKLFNDALAKYNESEIGSNAKKIEQELNKGIASHDLKLENEWIKVETDAVKEALDAIEKYYNTCLKVEELLNRLATGENVGNQLLKATNDMEKAQESAKKSMDVLYLLSDSGSTAVTDSIIKLQKSKMDEANLILNAFKFDDDNMGFENINRGYQTLIKNAERYALIIEKLRTGLTLTFNELSFLQKYGLYYEDAAKGAGLFADAQNKVNESLKQLYEQATSTANDNVITKQYNDIANELTRLGQLTWNTEGNQKLEELRQKYLDVALAVGQLSTATDELKKSIKESLDSLFSEASNFKVNKDTYTDASENAVSVMNRKMSEWIHNNSAATDFIPLVRQLLLSLDGISVDGLNKVSAAFEDIKALAADAGQIGLSFGDALKKSFSGLARYLATYTSFYRIIGIVKQGINVVKEMDDALTEMRKVSDEPVSTLKSFQKESFGMANSVGTTAIQIQKSTADWMRLGETIDDAKESAKDATILLNVSEFSNIDDATKSLVSMSQAYKDLDKIEIIDKLNNIGNNFSISTDQLATGLQNAAAVLKTQGNDLDLAIALLTAGNAITLDVSKTSAGIRTIALRISGTEEAKDEIQDMGEDIDDFVVRTKSKTDAIIKDYTAVASNGYKGVSVLDDNGNLRDTYSILLDIAKVYKEILAEDKQRGTNRALALVETLAGKNRSNIAASILENPKLLEDVYNTSLDSAGSAMQENEKYLDSISGKLQILKNELQELATLTIDSDWLKVMVDLATKAVELFNGLSKSFGGFNTIIGSIAGFFMQRHGLGMLKTSKGTGWANLLSGLFSKAPSTLLITKTFKPLDEAGNAFIKKWGDKVNKNGSFLEQYMGATGTTMKGLKNESSYFAPLIKEVGEAKAVLMDYNEIQLATSTGQVQIALTVINSTSAFAKLGSGLKAVASASLTTAAVMAGLFIIEKVVEGIYKWIKADEIAIEKGKQATQDIEDRSKSLENLNKSIVDLGKSTSKNDKLDNLKDSVTEIAKRYEELKKGVDETTNENVDLSTEDYLEYLDLCNQIASLSETLVSRWDDQGNAILNIGTSASDAEANILRMYEALKLLANVEIGELIQDSYTGFMKQIEDYEDLNVELQGKIKEYEENTLGIVTAESSDLTFDDEFVTMKNYSENKVKELKEALKSSGIEINSFEKMGQYAEGETAQFRIDGIEKASDDVKQTISDLFVTEVTGATQLATDTLTTEISEMSKLMSVNDLFIQDQKKSISNIIGKYLKTSDVFSSQSSVFQGAFLENLDNLDLSVIQDKYEGHILPYIYKEIIGPINDLLPEILESLDKLILLPANHISAIDYRSKIISGLNNLFGAEDAIKWADLLGFSNIFDGIIEALDDIFNELGGRDYVYNNTPDVYENILGLNLDDLKLYALIVKEGLFETWDDILTEFEKRKKTPELKPDGLLKDIFADEDYKTNTEGYEKSLSSLSSALETLRSDGKLTSEAMRDLQEEFPSLTDFTEDAIGDLASQKLGDWITELLTKAKELDFSPEGMDLLNTYIQNLVMSYGELSISAEEAKEAVRMSMVTADSTQVDEFRRQTSQYEDTIKNLQDKYGEELNWEVVWMLALEDKFSDPAADIYSEYNDLDLVWHLNVELENDINQLEKEISGNEARESANEAAREYMEQTQEDLPDLTKDYYNMQLENYNDMVREHGKDSQEAKAAKEAMQKAYNEMDLSEAGSFEETLELDRKNIENKKDIYLKRKQQYDNLGKEDITSKEYSDMLTALADYYQSLIKYDLDSLSSLENDIKDYTHDVSRLEREASDLQNQRDDATRNGLRPSKEIMDSLKNNYRDDVIILDQIAAFWELVSITGETQGIRNTALENANTARDAANNLRQQALDILSEQEGYSLHDLQSKGELLSIDTQQKERIISEYEELGKRVTEEMYDAAINSAKEELKNYWDINNELYKNKQDFEARWKGSAEDLYKNDDYKLILTSIASNNTSLSETELKIRNLTEEKNGLPLKDLQNELSDLQANATIIQDLMSLNEAKGLKTSVKQYEKLVKNSKELIKNLQKQNAELAIQRIGLDKNDSKYREITDLINSNRSAIRSAQQDLFGYLQSAATLISSNALNLASAISSAMSEMNSETGITTDTMRTLEQAFSDLYGRDVSNIFYETSDGMKMNVDAARDLIEAEYELLASNLKAEIELQNQIIENQKGLYTEDANAAVDAANKRIDAATRELAMLQALYDQQLQTLSGYGQWQIAESTANAGARYTGLQGNVENIKKAYEQGLTGTDEFKTYVEMLDQWGEDTIGAYNRVLPKIDRYLTDNYQGTKNFYDDLVSKGFGTFEDNAYNIAIPNVKEAADALGISEEWFDIMMSRGEDYGFSNDWVSSVVDGELKIKDVTQDLIDEQKHYQELLKSGAPKEVLKESELAIEAYRNSLKNLHENTEDVRERQGTITSTELLTAAAQIEAINKELGEGLIDPTVAKRNIQEIADESNILLTTDINGNLIIDKEAMDEQFPEWDIPVKIEPQWDNITEADTENNPAYASAVDKLLLGWSESSTELQGYLDTLNGADISLLKELNLDDGKIDVSGLEKEEKALDKIKEICGLTAEEATHLVEVLDKVNAFNATSSEKTYDKENGGVIDNIIGQLPGLGAMAEVGNKVTSFIGGAIQEKAQEFKDLKANEQLLSPVTDKLLEVVQTGTEIVNAITDAALNIGDTIGDKISEFLNPDKPTTSIEDKDTKIVDTPKKDNNGSYLPKAGEPGLSDALNSGFFHKNVQVDYTENLDNVEDKNFDVEAKVNFVGNTEDVEQKEQEIESNPITKAVNVVTNFIGGLFGGNKEEQPELVESTETTTIQFKPGSTDEVDTAIEGIKSKALDNPVEIPINAKDDGATETANQIETDINGRTPEMRITGNASAALGSADAAVGVINTKTAQIKVSAETSTLVNSVSNALSNRTFTANVVANITGTLMNVAVLKPSASAPSSDKSGFKQQLQYTGTLLSHAHATGTLKDFDDYIIGGKAHANGDVTIPQDEDSLVNELGTESIIRDGIWRLIPGGMHVEHLKKGDIILNHLLTRDLIEDGKAFGNGKLIGNAFAKGTAFNGMPAHVTPASTDTSNVNPWNKLYVKQTEPSGTGNLGKTIEEAGNKTQNAGNDVKDAAENTETALERFKKWADSLFDWIEVRMERLQHSIDKSTALAELARTFLKKNSHIEDAMTVLQGRNTKAEQKQVTKEIKEEKAAAKKAGANLKKTTYGNIDMNNRQTITWDNKSLKKNKKALQSLDPDAKKNWKQYSKDLKGTTSTVFGASSTYKFDGKSIDIAFSPMLQTDKGAVMLTQDTIDKYISTLIKNANGDTSKLIELDVEGADIGGKRIKGILADVGKSARKTAEQMHYVGAFGSIEMGRQERQSLRDQMTGKIKQDKQSATRYYKQADLVLNRAISDGILSADKIAELVSLIKNGAIDIAEYEATKIDLQNLKNGSNSKEETPITDFIAAYKEWYDKALAMELQYYEDRLDLIEREQTQLDNITEEFDSRSDLFESRLSRIDSEKQLSLANGEDPRSKSIKQNVSKLLAQQDFLRNNLDEEAYAYKQEMEDAIKAFGKDSNQYRLALAQYNEIILRKNEADLKYIEMQKDYEKERLDFIQKRYETDVNYAESVKATSESLTSLYRAQGKAEDSKDIKKTYNKQIDLQEKVTSLLSEEMENYRTELKRAKKIYGEGSDEYKEALITYKGMSKALNESKEATIQLKRDLMELDITVIGYGIDRLQHKVGLMGSITDLIAKRGKRANDSTSGVKESDYTNQISINNDIKKKLQERIDALREEQKGLDENSQAYMDLENRIWADSDAMIDLMSRNEDLAQQVRELRWKPFNELSDKIDDAIGDYDHLISLMNEQSFFDDFGDGYKLTIDGLSALALYGELIDANERKIALYKEGLLALTEEYKNGNISEEQYIQLSREFKGVIQSSASAIKQEREQIIALYKTQMTNEANALKKNIDAYKELLERKRSYYDYDRQLSDKNKNIQMLERELRALEGVAGAEAAAERAKIEADLYEAKRDRDDTVQEHTYNLRTQGLDDLEKDIDETLDRNLRAVEASTSVLDLVVSDMLGKVLLNYNTAYEGTGGINEVIGSAGTKTTKTTAQQELDTGKMLDNTRTKYATDVLKMKNELDSLMAKNAANNNEQYKATDKMLTDTKTDYNTVYGNIQQLITETGTKVGTEAETSMGKMKETISTAMKTTEEGINKWIEKNKDKGFTIETKLIETGNEGKTDGETDRWRNAANPDNGGGTKSASGGGTKGGSTGGGTKASANAAGGAKKDTKDTKNAGGAKHAATGGGTKKDTEVKTVASNTKSVDAVIKSLSSRSKTITEAEKKNHSGLWEYVAKNYGKSITGKGIIELADALGVYVSATSRKANKPTSVEKITVLDALKRYDKTALKTGISSAIGIGLKTGISSAINKKGYAKGTLGTKQDELNWTHEGEIIRMADGAILRQLPQGTQVIPRLESQNLMKWALMDPNKWTHEGINLEVVKSTPNQEINPVLNYSPTINGTGLNEQQVLDLLKKDREDAFRDFTNRIRKDLRMSGR